MEYVQYIVVDKKLRENTNQVLSKVVEAYYLWFKEKEEWTKEEQETFQAWFQDEQGKIVLNGSEKEVTPYVYNGVNKIYNLYYGGVGLQNQYGNLFLSLPNKKEILQPKFQGVQIMRKPTYALDRTECPQLAFYINSDLNMSLGKTIAQIGHVCTTMFNEQIKEVEDDCPIVHFEFCSQEQIEEYVNKGYSYIRDNGHTEVPPNSLTVAGTWL